MTAALQNAPTIEWLSADDVPLACLIRACTDPAQTQFFTPPGWTQQVGFVVYPAGASIARHAHKPIRREITGTGEVLVVRSGRCELDLFDERGLHVSTNELRPGDVLILVAGGHGFRMLEDTVLLEVKQGPFTGLDEKVFF